MEREYENKQLEKVVEMAKDLGLKVWTFKTDGPITQVFFDNGNTYGTAEAYFGGLRYGTCHKPNRYNGEGFSLTERNIEPASTEWIMETFKMGPSWARGPIKKESFQEHMERNKILEYYEL